MIEIVESTTVSRVWAGHPVRFDLLTRGKDQFVAFYDAERRMTVAARTQGQASWTLFQPPGEWLERRQRLSTVLGWVRYILRWETLCSNRDRPRETAPPPSELRVHTLWTRTLERTRESKENI
jgi:hypothetical protein